MENTFAKINARGIVTTVIVADQSHIDALPDNDSWVQTWGDANGNPAKAYNYAGIGFKYDAANNAFIAPQQYPSWSLDSKFQWQPPVPYPSEPYTQSFHWDEAQKAWVADHV